MKQSLSTFVYYRYTLEEAIKRIASFGYDGVEIWGGRPHAYFEDMGAKRIESIRKLLEENNLGISNFIPAQFRYPSNIGTSHKEIRENSVKYIKNNIDVANALGAPYVSICPGFSVYPESRKEAYQGLLKSIEEILAYNSKVDGDTMVILEPAHPMETDLVATCAQAIEIIDIFGKENLGILPDLGHLRLNKEPIADTFDFIKDYKYHIHIADNLGVNDDHLCPGDGNMDYSIFIEKIRELSYDGYICSEIGFGNTDDPDIVVKRNIEFMRKLEA